MSAIETSVWQNPFPASVQQPLDMIFNSLTAWLLANWTPNVGGSTSGLDQFSLWNYGTKDKVLAFDVHVSGAAITSASLTSAHQGKTIVVDGAGPSGGMLVTTLATATAGSGTLTVSGSTVVSNACGVWGTDDTAAWTAAWAAAYAAGGGQVVFDGISLVTGQVILPNDGTTFTPTNGAGPPNIPQVVGPSQPPMRMSGIGQHWDGQWGGTFKAEGSLLVCGSSTAPSGFVTEGTGAFEVDHLTVLMLQPDTEYFLRTTNTTVFAHHGATIGRPSKLKSTCSQTVFSFGGSTTTVGVGTNDAYQGYGSFVSDWYFDRIRHVLDTGQFANSLWLHRLTCSLTCGSATSGDAPIWFTSGVAHQVVDAVAEMAGYANGFVVGMVGVTNSAVLNPIEADATSGLGGWVYFGTGSTDNLVVGSYRDNPTVVPPIVEVAGVLGANNVVSALQADSGVCVMTSSDTGGTMSVANSVDAVCHLNVASLDPCAMADTANSWIKVKMSGIYQVNGQVAYGNSGTLSGSTIGQVAAALAINGADTTVGGRVQASGYLSTAMLNGIFKLNAGDKLTLKMFQTSGGTADVYGPNCWLSAKRIS